MNSKGSGWLTTIIWYGLVISSVLFSASRAVGDMSVRGNSLMDIVPRSNLIVAGNVSSVTQSTNTQLAGITINRVFHGRPETEVSVYGSISDPELPNFEQGERVLLFLEAGRGGNYSVVRGAAGKFTFGAGQESIVSDIAGEYSRYRKSQDVPDRTLHYQNLKRWVALGSMPDALLAGFIHELESAYDDVDDPQWIEEVLNNDEVNPLTTKWAIRTVGRHKMNQFSGKIKEFADSDKRYLRAEAVHALGALNDGQLSDVDFTEYLDDGNPGVRQNAVEVLMRSKSPDAAKALFDRYSNESNSVIRVAIIEALQRLPQGNNYLRRLESVRSDRNLNLMLNGVSESNDASLFDDPETIVIANDPEDPSVTETPQNNHSERD